METKQQLAKNYTINQELIPDSYVDTKDTVNHWCVAQVVEVDPEKNQVKIHFEGWSSKYDEWIKRNSQRLAPFRRHTYGYTGQKKNAIRDFKISLPQQVQMSEEILEIIEKEFTNFESPYKLTQFIRGRLYFYVDSLISLTQASQVDDLSSIFDFMTLVFKLILKWMEIFPQYLKAYQETTLLHPNLYLVDMDAAIASCGYELFDILGMCFGRCQRCAKFFLQYSNQKFFDGTEQFVNNTVLATNKLQASFINNFGSLKGFRIILDFIDFEVQDSKGKSVKGCPFQMVLNALSPIQTLIQFSDKKFMDSFATQVKKSLTLRLENLQEQEIKELDKDILNEIIYTMRAFIKQLDPQNCDEIAEMFELKIAEKYLRCNFFEKRVRGINEFKEIYYKVQNSYQRNDQPSMRWLNNEKFAQWILQQGIIEFIFTENPHVELIKRSFELLRLLAADDKTFTPEIVEMLWSCCRDKHEDIIRATLDLIQDLALWIPLERLLQFFQKLQTLKESEYDEKLVSFLKIYTISTMKNIRRKRDDFSRQTGMNSLIKGKPKEVKIDPSSYIDLSKFWLIFQEANKVSQKIKDLALNSLIEILVEFNDSEYKLIFIQMCLDNIKKGDTFYSSLLFLRKILKSYPLDAQNRQRSSAQQTISVTQILHDIFQKIDLFDLIFQNTEIYLTQALSIISTRSQRAGQSEKIGLMNVNGMVNHDDFIWAIFDFIEFVLVNSRVPLKFENVEKMFNLFVTQAISENETDTFFQMLTKENERGKSAQTRFLLEDKVRKEVFQKIFCNNKQFNCEKINLQGFICFKRLFLIINEEEKSVEKQKEDRVVVLNLNQVQGLETLWNIAIQSQTKEVKDLCKDFLVDLYLKTRTKSESQKRQIIEMFPLKCLQYFKISQDRPDHQLNCLRLIRNFISRFDGDHIEEENVTQYDPRDLKTIAVTLNPDKITIQIQILSQQKLWQLKRKMATQFKMKMSEFYIKTKQGPLDEFHYDDPIKEYRMEVVHIQRVPKEEMEREFPRYLIGYNQDYMKQFLELLKCGSEDCKIEVLSLIEILPISPDVKTHFKDNIQKFSPTVNNIASFNFLFQWKDLKKDMAQPCYFIMVLEELMIPKKELNTQQMNEDIQAKYEFALVFVKVGGFDFLINCYKQLDKENLERDITRTKILTIILRLLNNLFSKQQLAIVNPLLTSEIICFLISETQTIVQSFVNTVRRQQQQQELKQEELKDTRLLKLQPQIFSYSLNFLQRALISHPLEIKTYYEFSGMSAMIIAALIDIENDAIQIATSKNILDLCLHLESDIRVQTKPSYFFMNILINDCLDYALSQTNTRKTQVFFNLLNSIFLQTEVHKELATIRPILQLSKDLSAIIYDRQIFEVCARDEDVALSGILTFFKNLLHKFPEMREQFPEKNKLLQFILHDCLFHKETRGLIASKQKAFPPKCKNNNTRDRCLEILQELCLNNTEGLFNLTRYLKSQISETYWRTPRRNDWGINVHQQERSLTGFVGLKNIGCICYMNSFMQQLFMIPSFRKSILEVEDNNYEKEPNDENVLYQLKMIFGGLMETEKQYFNPKKFCGAFKDIDGQPLDPMVQKDADEFFGMLMDRVENLIKGKREDKIVRNLFQGVLANEFICKGCPHYSEREEPFLVINLQVKNKHSIKESLDAFVEGEMLEGDNAYYCEKCEKKVNTLKRCCIKRMPNVLFMVLKRFEFNYDTMTKFKINDLCEFPMSINMSDYGQESLAKKDLEKQMQDKNLTLEDLNEDQRAIFDKQVPQKYYEYNLKGVVVHMGTAEQGHYISLSQDRENPNGKWFEFNDQMVKEFDPADIPYETFGGDDDQFVNQVYQQNLQTSGIQNEQFLSAMKQMKTKIKNAYVLIYEREEIIDMERFNEMMDDPEISTKKQEIAYRFDQCKIAKINATNIQIPLPVHEQILEKNKKFWLSKFMFNKNYIDQVYLIFNNIQVDEDDDYAAARAQDLQTKEGDQFEQLKFLTTFFLTTVLRAKERKPIPFYMKIIRNALQKNVSLSVWLLETFSNQNLIKELLIDCPIPDLKRFAAGLLKTAMQKVYKYEEQSIAQYIAQIDQNVIQFVQTSQEADIKQHREVNMTQSTPIGEPINSSSLCQNVNLFILKNHTIELPVLIIFINSMIHMSVSQHIYSSQLITGQFYMVFSHFCSLGDQARLYLLKNKQMGRLLDTISGGDPSKTAVMDKFRNESLQQIPLFVIEKDFYIAQNLEKTVYFLTMIERKQILKDATPFQTFIVHTIAQLARSCKFVQSQTQNPYQLDTLNFKPETNEISLIINFKNENFWRISSQSKLSRNSVADIMTQITFDNKDLSIQLIQFLLESILKSSFESFKIYERALIKQVLIKDEYQPERAKKVVGGLTEIIQKNLGYYKDVDSLIDLLFKLAQRSQHTVESIQKSQKLFRLIEQWTKEYPHIPLNQSKIKIFKQGIVNPRGLNQILIQRMEKYSKDRLEKLKSLFNKETQTDEALYDSEDDMYNYPFQEGEKIDYKDTLMNDFQSGSIDMNAVDMMRVARDPYVMQQLQQTNKMVQPTIWIEAEGDKLAPYSTASNSEKRYLHNYYLQLLSTLQQQN